MDKYTALDLFAGCGGLSKGLIDAGFCVLAGVDNDEAALKTFERNHDGAIALNVDLSQECAFNKIDNAVGNRAIDVIVAGPPCQGFSVTGPRNFNDDRNKLYMAVFKAVRRYQPKAFIIENVPGMATLYKGAIKIEVINRFGSLGYNIESDILCAADFGVPQMRKRLIFFGVRMDIGKPVFPSAVCSTDNYVTCREAISDLPSRNDEIGKEEDVYTSPPSTEFQRKMRKNSKVLYNHVATAHKQFVIDVIRQVPEGCNYKSLPKGVGDSRKFKEAWTRYHGDKPSKTIDTGHRNHFHYEYDRVPTIRENARLQSFPDDFVFVGTKTQQNRQVGNAVPPLLGFYLGERLRNIIDEWRENTYD